MVSLATFITYISTIILLKKYYIVFFAIFPISACLIFLEYNHRKKIRKYVTYYLFIGMATGAILGFLRLNQYGQCRLNKQNYRLEARIVNVSSSFYILEMNHFGNHIDRIKLYRKPTDPNLFLFDRIQWECHEWAKYRRPGFYRDLENLQSTENVCFQGKISAVHEVNVTFNKMRRDMQSEFNRALNRLPGNSYARGFLLGDTKNINPVELNVFRKMGVAHLFSPSGLHMGLLYGSCFLPFSLAGFPVAGQVSGLVICVFYLCILDFQIPLFRSFVFIILYFILKSINRTSAGKYTLYITGILMEFLFPLSCFSVSFILSFFITLIILLFFPIFGKVLPVKYAKLRDHLAITLSASAGACFLSLFFFNYYHPVSVIYNFLLVPPSGIYLASVLLYILFRPFQCIILAGDFIFRQCSWIHYSVIEKNLPGINILFCEIWMVLFLLLTVFLGYHALKKQFWYLRKYYLKLYMLLALLFPLNHVFNVQPVAGRIAFPYGVIEYRNRDLYVAGSLSEFYENKFSGLIQNLNIPFRNIHSPGAFKHILHQTIIHPLQNIEPDLASQNKGILQIQENCYFFIHPRHLKKFRHSGRTACKNIYLVMPKKRSPDIPYYKKVYTDFFPKAEIHVLNYSKWQWEYKNEKAAK